jgi:hypothetical protein
MEACDSRSGGGRLGFPEFATDVNDGARNVFDAVAFAMFHEPFATAWENAATQLAVQA